MKPAASPLWSQRVVWWRVHKTVDLPSAGLPNNPRMLCVLSPSLWTSNWTKGRKKVGLLFFFYRRSDVHSRSSSEPHSHLPSGGSAGLSWKAWFTTISWARAMLLILLAVSISSSTETSMGGLAVRERDKNHIFKITVYSTPKDANHTFPLSWENITELLHKQQLFKHFPLSPTS